MDASLTLGLSPFPELTTLVDLTSERHLTKVGETEQAVLALDFDQVLVEAEPTLGDEHCYKWLNKMHNATGLCKKEAHYAWIGQLREKIDYRACETVETVNNVIEMYRQSGWKVVVLTSRGEDQINLTEKHLKEAGLAIEIRDVIFKAKVGGKRLNKDEAFEKWMSDNNWDRSKLTRLYFADDNTDYCVDVARVAREVQNVVVNCWHYTHSLPKPEFSETQLKQLVVQLHAHYKGMPIPKGNFSDEEIRAALKGFGMLELNEQTIYNKMLEITAHFGTK